jgi:hypothetical protein
MRIEFSITPSTVFRKIACKLILVYFWSHWANWNTIERKRERERERERGTQDYHEEHLHRNPKAR